MNATWAEYENLPFAPGTSPFRLKGIAYRGHIEYANKFVPGGTAAVNAAFRNPLLAPFFEQQFLAASWYDALPILPVWHVCARLANQPAIDFLKRRTRHQAEGDINGVYKLILKLASAETVALRIPRVVGKYFDFGSTNAEVVRPGMVRLTQTGIPTLMSQWFAIVGDTFLQVALEIAGAKGISVRRKPIALTGEVQGMHVGTIVADVEFDPASAHAET